MKLEKSKTFNNLAKAFAGECQARTRYEFMEYGLRYNGYNALASIIDKLAYQEFNHARMFYTFIQKVNGQIDNIEIATGYPFKQKWDYVENLRLASIDERDEVDIYHGFANTAREEGLDEIALLFDNVASVEMAHHKLLSDLHEKLENKSLYTSNTPKLWVCASCGFATTAKQAWDTCPLCLAKQGYVEIDGSVKK